MPKLTATGRPGPPKTRYIGPKYKPLHILQHWTSSPIAPQISRRQPGNPTELGQLDPVFTSPPRNLTSLPPHLPPLPLSYCTSRKGSTTQVTWSGISPLLAYKFYHHISANITRHPSTSLESNTAEVSALRKLVVSSILENIALSDSADHDNAPLIAVVLCSNDKTHPRQSLVILRIKFLTTDVASHFSNSLLSRVEFRYVKCFHFNHPLDRKKRKRVFEAVITMDCEMFLWDVLGGSSMGGFVHIIQIHHLVQMEMSPLCENRNLLHLCPLFFP